MDDLGVPSFQETFILGPGLHDHPSGVRFFGQTPATMLKVQTRMGCTKRQDGELACPFPLSRVQPGISRCISKVSTILSLCILSWNPTLRRKSCSPLRGEGLRLRSCLVVGPITVGNHHSKYILGKSGTTKIHKTSNMTDFLRVFCLVRKTSVQVDRCVVSLQIVHVLDVPTARHP